MPLLARFSWAAAAVLAGVAALGACDADADPQPSTTIQPTTSSGAPGPSTTAPDVTTTENRPAPARGTLVWVHHEEPTDLHADDPENSTPVAAWVQGLLWEGLFGVGADEMPVLELLAEEPEVSVADDGSMTVRYRLRDGLRWSDGAPLTSDDAMYTLDMIRAVGRDGDPVYRLVDRGPYDAIVDYASSSQTEFTITWDRPLGAWRSVLATVHPAHVFDDDPIVAAAEENEALRAWFHDGVMLPSSGPLVLESWSRGVNMRFVRNPSYHGSTHPNVAAHGPAGVEAVVLRFVGSPAEAIVEVQGGRADLALVPGGQEVTDVEDGVEWREVWGATAALLLVDVSSTHLSDPVVREAVALAIDRALLPGEPLGSAYRLVQQPGYVDRLEVQGYGNGRVGEAQARLLGAGYLFTDDGEAFSFERGYLQVSVGSRASDVGIETLEVLAGQLRAAGFRAEIVDVSGDDVSVDLVVSPVESTLWLGDRTSWLGRDVTPEGTAFPASFLACDELPLEPAAGQCYDSVDATLTGSSDGRWGLAVLPLWQERHQLVVNTDRAVVPTPWSLGRWAGPLAGIVDVAVSS